MDARGSKEDRSEGGARTATTKDRALRTPPNKTSDYGAFRSPFSFEKHDWCTDWCTIQQIKKAAHLVRSGGF